MNDPKFVSKVSLHLEKMIQRFETAGFSVGDQVKIKKNILQSDFLKSKGQTFIDHINNCLETDLVLKISAIKSIRPNTTGNYQSTDAPDDFYCDVYIEYAPGQVANPITIPAQYLESVDNGINYPKIPDSLKRKNTVENKEADLKNNPKDFEQNLTTTDKKNSFAKKPGEWQPLPTKNVKTRIFKDSKVIKKSKLKLLKEDVAGEGAMSVIEKLPNSNNNVVLVIYKKKGEGDFEFIAVANSYHIARNILLTELGSSKYKVQYLRDATIYTKGSKHILVYNATRLIVNNIQELLNYKVESLKDHQID